MTWHDHTCPWSSLWVSCRITFGPFKKSVAHKELKLLNPWSNLNVDCEMLFSNIKFWFLYWMCKPVIKWSLTDKAEETSIANERKEQRRVTQLNLLIWIYQTTHFSLNVTAPAPHFPCRWNATSASMFPQSICNLTRWFNQFHRRLQV